MRNFPLVASMMIALGLINLFGAWRKNKQQNSKKLNLRATGIINALNKIPFNGDDAAQFAPLIRFTTSSGAEISFVATRNFYAGKLTVGQEITVFYSSDSSEKPELFLPTDPANFVKTCLLFSAITLVGLILLFV